MHKVNTKPIQLFVSYTLVAKRLLRASEEKKNNTKPTNKAAKKHDKTKTKTQSVTFITRPSTHTNSEKSQFPNQNNVNTFTVHEFFGTRQISIQQEKIEERQKRILQQGSSFRWSYFFSSDSG